MSAVVRITAPDGRELAIQIDRLSEDQYCELFREQLTGEDFDTLMVEVDGEGSPAAEAVAKRIRGWVALAVRARANAAKRPAPPELVSRSDVVEYIRNAAEEMRNTVADPQWTPEFRKSRNVAIGELGRIANEIERGKV